MIIGGGICGLLAAERCVREGIKFLLFERGDDYGGNWVVRANTYSHLQASSDIIDCGVHCQDSRKRFRQYTIALAHILRSDVDISVSSLCTQAHASLYQWDKDFPLDKNPFAKVAAPKVLSTIRGFAERHNISQHTKFGTEVTSITRTSKRRWDMAHHAINPFCMQILRLLLCKVSLGRGCSNACAASLFPSLK